MGENQKAAQNPAPSGMWWLGLCFSTDSGTQQLVTELSQGTAFLRDGWRCSWSGKIPSLGLLPAEVQQGKQEVA